MTDDDGSLVDYTSGGVLPCCLSGHVTLWFSSLHTIPKPDDGDFFFLLSSSSGSAVEGEGEEEEANWANESLMSVLGIYWWMMSAEAFLVKRRLMFTLSSPFNEGERSASLFDTASLFAWFFFAISFFFATHSTFSCLSSLLHSEPKISNN